MGAPAADLGHPRGGLLRPEAEGPKGPAALRPRSLVAEFVRILPGTS